MTFPPGVIRLAKDIELVSFDVDGVLTDGQLVYADDGRELKAFHVQDGHAIKLLRGSGLQVAIITGRSSSMVDRRAAELDIEYVFQGAQDKTAALEELVARSGVRPERMAHIGDDLPDLTLFEQVRLAIAVPNGHPTVIARADYVTTLAGGQGVGREVCQLILTARDAWPYQ